MVSAAVACTLSSAFALPRPAPPLTSEFCAAGDGALQTRTVCATWWPSDPSGPAPGPLESDDGDHPAPGCPAMVSGASWGSWNSWGSRSSCSSWHSACGPQDPGADQAPLWSSPTPAPWPPPQDSPWSLPVGLSAAPSETAQTVRAAQARRPSVVAALLSLQEAPNRPSLPRSASAPAHQPLTVDASAFSRYYEGSVVCPRSSPEDLGAAESMAGPCGGPLSSLALALPCRLEGLVKLLAQSLHLLLAAVCSRWGGWDSEGGVGGMT